MAKRIILLVVTSVIASVIPSLTMASTELSTLIEYFGEAANDGAGSALSEAGDVNGDGYDDFLIGSPSHAGVGANSGAAYLVYGSASVLESGKVSDTAIIKFSGESGGDMAAGSLAGAGDVNGDGYDDLLIGASSRNLNTGSVYLVYGKSAKFTSVSLSDAAFVEFTGESFSDVAGGSVAGAGDVNNDGYDDFLISSNGNSDAANFAGAVYLVYGKSAAYTDLSLGDSSVIKFTGATANDSLASGLDSGDVNGDGYSDLLLSSSSLDDSTGGFYIIYGQSSALSSMSISDSSVIKFTGENSGDNAGGSIASDADVNGDGYDDILVGAIQNSAGGVTAGAAYIIYGQSTKLATSSLGGTGIVKYIGEEPGDLAGIDLAMLGDVNGDGYDDFIIGGSMNDVGASNAGAVYLLFGDASKLTSVDLSDSLVNKFVGENESDIAGDVVSRAGDVNGDGFYELLASAYAHDGTNTDDGVTYLGYLYIDADMDGVAGGDGIFSGTDCNDADSTVYENQTYYIDADGDGLGDSETSTAVCSSVAPDGYVDDNTDTDDTLVNNGIEFLDGIDNDGDGEIDEENTLDDNGPHPGYGDLDPDDITLHDTAITSVTGQSMGQIQVTYNDTSVYTYTIFENNSSVNKKTKVKQYRNTGYYLILQAQGKKVALVNIYNGTVIYVKTITNKSAYARSSIKVFKIRTKYWAVVTSKKKNGKSRLSLVQINIGASTLGKKATATFTQKKLNVNKTKKKKNRISLKNKKKVLIQYQFTKNKKLKVLP